MGPSVGVDVFVAHLPAGYLLSRALDRTRSRAILAASLVGSVLPDVDMLWFHFVDEGRVHHHRYWTHVPLFWAAVAVPALVVTAGLWPRWSRALGAFFVAVASHLVLDTIVGDIQWLQPFSDRFIHLVSVKRIADWHWVWAFVLHWTFALELGLLAAAGVLALRCPHARSAAV